MRNIFNDYVKTLETYIMFTIKAKETKGSAGNESDESDESERNPNS